VAEVDDLGFCCPSCGACLDCGQVFVHEECFCCGNPVKFFK